MKAEKTEFNDFLTQPANLMKKQHNTDVEPKQKIKTNQAQDREQSLIGLTEKVFKMIDD